MASELASLSLLSNWNSFETLSPEELITQLPTFMSNKENTVWALHMSLVYWFGVQLERGVRFTNTAVEIPAATQEHFQRYYGIDLRKCPEVLLKYFVKYQEGDRGAYTAFGYLENALANGDFTLETVEQAEI